MAEPICPVCRRRPSVWAVPRWPSFLAGFLFGVGLGLILAAIAAAIILEPSPWWTR